MKSEKLRLYIIQIAVIIFFLLAIIFPAVITKRIVAVVLLVFMVISIRFIKSGKLELTNNQQITAFFVGMGIIYVAILYFLGFFTGFYQSTFLLSTWSIINYIIPYIVIIVSAEIIRKKILLKEDKFSSFLVLVAMVMLDIILNSNIHNLRTVNDYFVLVSFIIFASIANNLLFNYTIIKYRNVKATILYRLLTILYAYILPITPDVYIFLESILKMVFPYAMYVILENVYAQKKVVLATGQRKKEIVVSVVFYIIIVIIAMLVSCKFKYGVLVIGSGSMTGTINKGDIVFFAKYGKDEEIETGDIIVFNRDGEKIVHRIIDQRALGTESRYYTKGDANQQEDDGYVQKSDIIGHVKSRIPFIGYLTLLVNNLVVGGSK